MGPVMRSRAVLGLVVALAVGCQGAGAPGNPGPEPAASPDQEDARALLATESHLRAETVFLLASSDYESSLSAFADSRSTDQDGAARILHGQGNGRIILERLTIDCKAYIVKLAPPAGPDAEPVLEIIASGDVVLERDDQTTRAQLLRADSTGITYEGEFESDVEYDLGARPDRP